MWVETPDFSILILFLILPTRTARAQRPSAAHGGVSADAAPPTGASRRDAGAAGDNRARVVYLDRRALVVSERIHAGGATRVRLKVPDPSRDVNARDGARRRAALGGGMEGG